MEAPRRGGAPVRERRPFTVFDHLLLPVDLSPVSLAALGVATRVAAASGVGEVTVLHVVDRLRDVSSARSRLTAAVSALGPHPVATEIVIDGGRTPASGIGHAIDARPGTLCVMRSHGHGRSAAVLGSTTDELLRARFGPVMVVGPHATEAPGRLDGPYLAPLDGSVRADRVLPILTAWCRAFHGSPRLLHVASDRGLVGALDDTTDQQMLADRARMVDAATRGLAASAQIEVIDDRSVAHAVTEVAERNGASLVFLATHGRSGINRLRTGSAAAGIVRNLTCPAVLFRPPSDDA